MNKTALKEILMEVLSEHNIDSDESESIIADVLDQVSSEFNVEDDVDDDESEPSDDFDDAD